MPKPAMLDAFAYAFDCKGVRYLIICAHVSINIDYSTRCFVLQIKAAAVANGDKAASYSSHSGRIGGATLLLQAGASVNTIKLAGRWKGDTWSIYSRMTSTAMYGVAADMIGASTKKQVNADNVRVR